MDTRHLKTVTALLLAGSGAWALTGCQSDDTPSPAGSTTTSYTASSIGSSTTATSSTSTTSATSGAETSTTSTGKTGTGTKSATSTTSTKSATASGSSTKTSSTSSAGVSFNQKLATDCVAVTTKVNSAIETWNTAAGAKNQPAIQRAGAAMGRVASDIEKTAKASDDKTFATHSNAIASQLKTVARLSASNQDVSTTGLNTAAARLRTYCTDELK